MSNKFKKLRKRPLCSLGSRTIIITLSTFYFIDFTIISTMQNYSYLSPKRIRASVTIRFISCSRALGHIRSTPSASATM